MFFPGGAADEITARRSRSRRRSGLVSTDWGTLSTRQCYLEYRHGPHLGLHPGYSEYHIEQLWVLLVLTGHYHAVQLPGVSTQGNVMGFSE
jgi:hypothetical protein